MGGISSLYIDLPSRSREVALPAKIIIAVGRVARTSGTVRGMARSAEDLALLIKIIRNPSARAKLRRID